uniref:Uncharacterized protein n=1 Tax=Vespula pensylvanica TaxID=30213 RepID=A0A834K0T2_VESPE|nr:hypothetical protein H0235_016658 [Vespula pensylvanica]
MNEHCQSVNSTVGDAEGTSARAHAFARCSRQRLINGLQAQSRIPGSFLMDNNNSNFASGNDNNIINNNHNNNINNNNNCSSSSNSNNSSNKEVARATLTVTQQVCCFQ